MAKKKNTPCLNQDMLDATSSERYQLGLAMFLERTQRFEGSLIRPRSGRTSSVGIEIEVPLEQGGRPYPGFPAVINWVRNNRPDYNEVITPEFLHYVAEAKSRKPFRFGDSISSVAANIADALEPVHAAAGELGIDVSLLSNFSRFDPSKAYDDLDPNNYRFQAITSLIDQRGHNFGLIPLADSSDERIQGAVYQGNTAGIHINNMVDGSIAARLEIKRMLAGLFTALMQGSPVLNEYLTTLGSVRTRIMPIAFWEAPAKEREFMPGRWSAIPFSLVENDAFQPYVSMDAYDAIRKTGRPDWVARLGAYELKYGTFLVTEKDLAERKLDRPQVWTPGGKWKYDSDSSDARSSLLETRTGHEARVDPETGEFSPEYLAKVTLASLALEEAAHDLYDIGKLKLLRGTQAGKNLAAASRFDAKRGRLYWNGGREDVSTIVASLVGPAFKVLTEVGYTAEESQEILHSTTRFTGIYVDRQGRPFQGEVLNNPAEHMREIARQHQPSVFKGKERLRDETLEAMAEQYTLRPGVAELVA